jgi:hypothetical protein
MNIIRERLCLSRSFCRPGIEPACETRGEFLRAVEAFPEDQNITQAEVLVLVERCRPPYVLETISKTSRFYGNHSIKRGLSANPLLACGVAFRVLAYFPFVARTAGSGRSERKRARGAAWESLGKKDVCYAPRLCYIHRQPVAWG